MSPNLRSTCALSLQAIFEEKRSTEQLPWPKEWSYQDQKFATATLLACLREANSFRYLINELLEKPFKPKDSILEYLLIVACVQIARLDVPAHAVVNETVSACQPLQKPWAKGLINAVLRRFIELPTPYNIPEGIAYNHPAWLIKLFKKHYPSDYLQIIQANNQRPPRFVRLEANKCSEENWLAKVNQPQICVSPVPNQPLSYRLSDTALVPNLYGFSEGLFTVQDLHAQLAAPLLAPQAGEKILDACAAPGGKTAHLQSLCPDADISAMDNSPKRIERMQANFKRLGYNQINTLCQDARQPLADDLQYDAILCDVPCSATGVIRRHPEIRWTRSKQDIQDLVQIQREILDNLWQSLRIGGRLLYATCSVLSEENLFQMLAFMERHPSASLMPMALPNAKSLEVGQQLLPTPEGGDGFYFALVKKNG